MKNIHVYALSKAAKSMTLSISHKRQAEITISISKMYVYSMTKAVSRSQNYYNDKLME